MASPLLYNLEWFDARDLARSGYQVRLTSMAAGWFQYWRGAWWKRAGDGTVHLVRASEFTDSHFMAHNWTTAPYGSDPCAAHVTPSDADLAILAMARKTYGAFGLRRWSRVVLAPPVPEFLPPA